MEKSKETADHNDVLEMSDKVTAEIAQVPRCKVCNGKGTVKPLFFDLECTECDGAGIDLSDPLAVIKLQKGLLAKAKQVIIHQRQSIYCLTVGDEQRTADNMNKFYAASKRID